MATKMCFAVGTDEAFEERIVKFEYIKGMAFSQKQKNVLSFHKSISEQFPGSRIIEISTKSQPIISGLRTINSMSSAQKSRLRYKERIL